VPIIRGSTSLGAHVRALMCVLLNVHAVAPVHRRKEIREHIRALTEAYPRELMITDSDMAQALAEEDGIPQED